VLTVEAPKTERVQRWRIEIKGEPGRAGTAPLPGSGVGWRRETRATAAGPSAVFSVLCRSKVHGFPPMAQPPRPLMIGD
jgi:hypothetical protein